MKARTRSISGAVMMLVIIPIFAGLLACMPVPIGDPDRSRIDPAMSGFWIMGEDGDIGGELYLFRPYDKHTWLVIGLELGLGKDATFDADEINSLDDLVAALRAHPVGTKGFVANHSIIFKGWLAKIGGRRLVTWEPIGDIHYPDSFSPEHWYVFTVDERRDDYYQMHMLAPDDKVFEALIEAQEDDDDWDPWKARRQWERALRRNIGNPDLYSDETYEMHRLPDDLFDKAVQLFEMAVEH